MRTLWFLMKFGALVLLGYAFLAIPSIDRILYGILEATAQVANEILKLIDCGTSLEGTIIRSPRFTVTIMRGCDGVEPTFILWAAILSVRASIFHKFIGMAVSAFFLQLLNLLRIVSLFEVGIYWPGSFHTLHVEIWPMLFILAELGLFIGWSRWALPAGMPKS